MKHKRKLPQPEPKPSDRQGRITNLTTSVTIVAKALYPALLDYINGHGMVVFDADIWATDRVPMSPEKELHLILSRIDQVGRGIVLLHDTKKQTAAILPAFLRELKRRGYHIVQAVPPKSAQN